MISANISFDFSELKQLQDSISKFNQVDKTVLPATSAAFNSSAQLIKKYLANYLSGGSLDGIRELTDKEISSIKGVKITAEQLSDFHSVVTARHKNIGKLTEGSPAVDYDMKKTHPYGVKSRVSKEGIPYLIIPFRWGTPNGKGTARRWNNVIPQKEYDTIIKAFEMSTVKNTTHVESNFKGQAVDRAEYKWKSRLKESDSWDDNATGMVRMKDVKGSTYFTFRIISAKSPEGSWLYHKDETEAINILGALINKTTPMVENIIESGLKTDLELL